MSELRGTAECPICGLDKPHTHEDYEIALRDTASEMQRKSMRVAAELQIRGRTLKEEFDRSPRDYVTHHGTINSFEAAYVGLEKPALAWAQAERLRDDRAASLTRAEEEASLRKLSSRQACGDLTERDLALQTTLAKETEAWREADRQEQACDHAMKEAARRLLDK